MKQYYLAHQLKNRHKIREIQKKLEFYSGITLINPFYDSEREEVKSMDDNKTNRYSIPMERCIEIVDNDLTMIKSCDGIICILLDNEALGSYMEIFFASYVLNIPVYLITPDKNLRNHVWIKVMCYKIFSSVKEFERYIKENKKDMI